MSSTFESQDIQDYLDFDLYLKIELCIEFLFTVIGNAMCLVIMHYEQFGGDPMKRGLENKLMSSIGFAQILGLFPSAALSMVRALFGPVNIAIATMVWFVSATMVHFASLMLIWILSNKNLSLLASKFVNHQNEEFWFTFSQIFSLTLSIILSLVMYILNDGSFPVIKNYAGLPFTQTSYVKSTFFLMGLGAFLTFASHFIISIYKAIQQFHESEVEDEVDSTSTSTCNNLYNNLVHNPNVLNDLQLSLICSVYVVTGLIPLIFSQGNPPETVEDVFWHYLPARWIFGFTNPALFLYFNPAIGEHFKRSFWDDWAPGWLQKYNPYLITLEDNAEPPNQPESSAESPQAELRDSAQSLRSHIMEGTSKGLKESKASPEKECDSEDSESIETQPKTKPAQPRSRMIFVKPAVRTFKSACEDNSSSSNQWLTSTETNGSKDLDLLEEYLKSIAKPKVFDPPQKSKFSKNGGKGVKSSKGTKTCSSLPSVE